MKLLFIAVLSLAFAWLICYGAMRTAERIASGRMSPDLVEVTQ